ncbi:exodeoxyribonuclease V subunit beta [Crenobacter intestini]|uniref:RecBCD enzyme subunit RecB n=1 Tax=Crenobacter intestini TaxID=2563443 RepID=A0A4T0ULZ5_9NEIS|nr:exodeoxyribonuclease V subunit beta [Crenobacter intestini]TIC79587.1 exodeoxyribonuclease V subunit beta [Crenobacter intestini]
MSAPLITPLDAANCPLSGVNLIEASAGTGKTWTIAALFVRLLLEGDAPPAVDQVLVVTYTKAATAELRGRLRARLVELRDCLEDESLAADPLVDALRARFAGEARGEAVARLTAAIAGFDGAAIYTIHGFCQRVLREAAFESGQTFEAELIADDTLLLAELAGDFWRARVVNDAQLARLIAETGQTPEAWLAEVRPFLARPYLELEEPRKADFTALFAARDAAWQALCAADVAGGTACLRAADGLNGRSYSPAIIGRACRLLEHLCADARTPPEPDRKVLDLFAKFTPAALEKGVNKGKTPPVHPLFDALEEWLLAMTMLQGALGGELARLKLELVRWIDGERARRRQATRTRGFDDLLTDFAAGLADPVAGPLLAAHVARSFRVALIDEFQDTDPVQYQVFRRCFVEAGAPVFLVGDPKQAIYSFRGADIFAYLAARDDARHHYTLDVNRRSSGELVGAVNALFARPAPFVLPGIEYHPVGFDPAPRARLEVDDQDAALTWLIAPAAGKPVSKDAAAEWAASACADEIARLIRLGAAGGARIVSGERARPFAGGDVAVLVATHRQGETMRQALRVRGVASVALTQQSVFASVDAREMLALMRAWAEPASERLLRAALATSLSGLSAAELFALGEDETAWEAALTANLADHARWRDQGFAAAWRAFSVRTGLPARLIDDMDGERRLTNLAHLCELIQAEGDERSALAPLMAWFEAKVADPGAGEEAMLRLETDADLVKIVTIHTSKGLQYPLVCCPFLWDGALERKETAFWRYHDGAHSRVVPALDGTGAARDAARREMLAEKLRLLYVALTRAQYRQLIAWRPVSGMKTAALSWLIHAQGADSLSAMEALELGDAEVAAGLALLGARLGRAMRVREASADRVHVEPALPPDEPLQLATLARPLYTPWRVSSFTALTARAHGAEAEAPDHDQALPPAAPDAPDSLLIEPRFAFARGTRAGIALHALFERIAPAASEDTIREEAAGVLARFGLAADNVDGACDLVLRTLAEPIAPGLTLADIPARRRLTELNFTRPLGRLSAARLQRLLADPALGLAPAFVAALASLDFRTVEGYLTGSIDLAFESGGVWYVVDYKSNYLGGTGADYTAGKLETAIAHAHYYLQYLFYASALRRYLASRGIKAPRIEVRYLFVRALDGSGAGQWRDTPSIALLDALDALFEVKAGA